MSLHPPACRSTWFAAPRRSSTNQVSYPSPSRNSDNVQLSPAVKGAGDQVASGILSILRSTDISKPNNLDTDKSMAKLANEIVQNLEKNGLQFLTGLSVRLQPVLESDSRLCGAIGKLMDQVALKCPSFAGYLKRMLKEAGCPVSDSTVPSEFWLAVCATAVLTTGLSWLTINITLIILLILEGRKPVDQRRQKAQVILESAGQLADELQHVGRWVSELRADLVKRLIALRRQQAVQQFPDGLVWVDNR
jgi:hypothetical protein